MREQAERLRLTLQDDGGGAEVAFKEVLKSELANVFCQYLDLDSIFIELGDRYISVKVTGDNFRRVGFYPEG